MTKEITQLTPQTIAVSVPLDAGKFNLGILGHTNMLQYFEGDYPVYGLIELPPGNYSILGLGDKISEEQWKEVGLETIVKPNEPLYYKIHVVEKDEDGHYSTATTNAKKAGLSLLKSLFLNPSELLIIIKT
jgi:hypothetical protein